MLVKLYGIFKEELETSVEVNANDLRQLLAGLSFQLGEERTQILYKTPLYYILGKLDSEEVLVMNPNFPVFEFGEFNVLHLVPEISGEIPVPFIVAALAFIGTTVPAWAAELITVIVNTVLMVAVSAVVQLLSPTPEFSSDPAQAQLKKSSLFNGVRQTTEQGGAVPLVYGRPYMTGIAISVGLYNEQFTSD